MTVQNSLNSSKILDVKAEIQITTFLIAITGFSQGMTGLADLAINYHFKEGLLLSPAKYAFYNSLIFAPWFIKPLWGYISDSVPIFGYRRKSYLILSSITQSFLWHVLASDMDLTLHQTVFLLGCIQVCICICNVIAEALMVEISRKFSENENATEEDKQGEATKNVSLFFGTKNFGVLITAYFSGLLLEVISRKAVFRITSLFPLMIAFTALLIKEDRVSYAELHANERNRNRGCCTLSPNIKKLFRFVGKQEILYPMLFVLAFSSTPSTSGAMFYFYTNDLKFPPNFLGQIKVVYAIAGLTGIFIYNKYLKTIPFKKIFFCSALITFCCGSLQLVLVNKWNRRLGLNDKLFTLFDSVIATTIAEINFMPVLVLAARICPKNIEGTMYALMMSISNFGGMLSMQFGSIMTYYFNVTENNFQNLASLIISCYVFFLVPLIFLPYLNLESATKLSEQEPSHLSSEILSKQKEESDDFEESITLNFKNDDLLNFEDDYNENIQTGRDDFT